MSKLIKPRYGAVLLVVGAVLAAGCSSSKKTSTTGTTTAPTSVKIGFIGALTGANAALGLNEYYATKLAVDQYNKKGGTQVDLTKYDSQGDPAQAP
ncbi:MAG: branched-chain amino acid transport system substrate-binding protein, partial [Acidimicrobiaceae bacterium]|nr:branched-chain amino acid transport system substrate-binding protein [Acidimicrobiaceae bacterium]